MKNIIETMTNLVEKKVEHYKSDFYDHDLKTLENPEYNNYIWILRDSGTWLFPEDEASNIYSYCLKYDNSVIGFYKLDIKADTITLIKDPQPLKRFEIIYKNSNNVFLSHCSKIDAKSIEKCNLLAAKYMQPEYDYFEVKAV